MRCELLNKLKTEYLDNLRSGVFEAHRERVNEENRMSLVILLAFTFIIIAVNMIVAPIVGGHVSNELVELGVYVLLALVAAFFIRRGKANYTLLVYLLELPLLLIALVSGTVFQPTSPTFSFLFFLLVLPSIILDKPSRVVSFIWVLGCAFAVLDSLFKPDAVFTRDMLHLLNACMISTAECLCLLSARIKNISFAAQFEEQTLEDPLTGLYNRAGAKRYADTSEPGALLFVDLDNFKKINDTFGHAEGDRVLKAVAETLRRSFRDGDAVIRMGGDEFAVFARGSWKTADLEGRLRKTLGQLEQIEARRGEESVAVSASIGCVVETQGNESFEEMVQLADREMYRVKTQGKDDYRIERLD